MIGTARNALVVVLCAITSYIFEMHGGAPYVLTGHIDAGLPTVELPPFSRTFGNQTESFIDITKNFKFGILVIPLIAIIGNVAIAKAFCITFLIHIILDHCISNAILFLYLIVKDKSIKRANFNRLYSLNALFGLNIYIHKERFPSINCKIMPNLHKLFLLVIKKRNSLFISSIIFII